MDPGVEQGDRSIIVSHLFPYNLEKVWKMWTDPRLIALWLCPGDLGSNTTCFDFFVGGYWKSVISRADGTTTLYDIHFTRIEIFKEICIRRDTPPASEILVEFIAVDLGITEIVLTELFASEHERNEYAEEHESYHLKTLARIESSILNARVRASDGGKAN